jgi:hypothetical protein
MGLYGGQGLNLALRAIGTNRITLQSGQCFTIPAGWWEIVIGKYSALQQRDPITGIWWGIGNNGEGAQINYFQSDGQNYRLANQTGCLVGALITNAGSGYTSAPTVTASAGSSIWQAVVGGAVNTTVTVTNGGTNYTYAPSLQFSAPPAGGIQATGYCTLSGSAVSTVTVTNQGAGYTTAPIITFFNDPREGVNNVTQGYNAAAVATLTGSGTITGLYILDHGIGSQAALPTLAFSGGGGSSAAATGIMCWSITAYAAGTAGVGLAGTVARISAEDAFPTTAAAYTNPATQSALVVTRSADIKAPISAGGITAAGQVIYDGGIYTSSPTPLVIPTASVVTTAPVVTFTLGGQIDSSYLQAC